MKRYLGVGVTLLLVMAALLLPQGWFALRDASTVGNMHGEVLDSLTVMQPGRSYERDIFTRMSTFLETAVAGDVICSQKEIDPGNESLWENIGQAQESILMRALMDMGYLSLWQGMEIESCTQYALSRKSDGQILLVANDICLLKEDGCRLQLLLDSVDGTIYYMESEEIPETSARIDWFDRQAVEMLLMLNDNYQAESVGMLQSLYDNWAEAEDVILMEMLGIEEQEDNNSYREYTDLYIRIREEENKSSYCCLLAYGSLSDSWIMEWEEMDGENYNYRLRLGLHMVIQNIPDLAELEDFTDYGDITDVEVEAEEAYEENAAAAP